VHLVGFARELGALFVFFAVQFCGPAAAGVEDAAEGIHGGEGRGGWVGACLAWGGRRAAADLPRHGFVVACANGGGGAGGSGGDVQVREGFLKGFCGR
jgi:hypothetical protein